MCKIYINVEKNFTGNRTYNNYILLVVYLIQFAYASSRLSFKDDKLKKIANNRKTTGNGPNVRWKLEKRTVTFRQVHTSTRSGGNGWERERGGREKAYVTTSRCFGIFTSAAVECENRLAPICRDLIIRREDIYMVIRR